jgi:hypothetical protein
LCYVAKLSISKILEEAIPVSHCRDEEVRISIIVDVRERARDRDRVRHGEACLVGDIPKSSVPQIPPELAGAQLGGEVEIREAIAIHVGGAHAIPVIIVNELVGFTRVVYDAVLERDAASLSLIRKPEIVRCTRSRGQFRFLPTALG